MRKLILFSFLFFSAFLSKSQSNLGEVFYSPNKVNGKPNVVLVFYDDVKTITINNSDTVSTFTSKIKPVETGVVNGEYVALFSLIGRDLKFRLTEGKKDGKPSLRITLIYTELGIQKTSELPLLKL